MRMIGGGAMPVRCSGVAFDSQRDAARAVGADEVIGQEVATAKAFEHALAPLLGVELRPIDVEE